MATSSGVTDPSSAPLTIAAFPHQQRLEISFSKYQVRKPGWKIWQRWNFCQKAFETADVSVPEARYATLRALYGPQPTKHPVYGHGYMYMSSWAIQIQIQILQIQYIQANQAPPPPGQSDEHPVYGRSSIIFRVYRSRYYICNENAINSLHRSQKDWYLQLDRPWVMTKVSPLKWSSVTERKV